MELNNTIEKIGMISYESYEKFLKLLFPAAPHITSELWESLAVKEPIEFSNWPAADKKYLVADEIEVVVQVNGKVRDKLKVSPDLADAELTELVLQSEKIKSLIDGKKVVKTIVVPNKLVSLVVKE
jgi:leucyl-tRNA synthetase